MHANILWTALNVAPLAGAWIEIVTIAFASSSVMVAPLAGAWIEIPVHPGRWPQSAVAPLAGAWIEMVEERLPKEHLTSRSPRGSVD